MRDKAAIIDLGSNSIRLTIWGINDNGSYRVLDKAKEIVRLGEGLSSDMNLKPAAMLRALATLRIFSHIIESHHVEKIYAVGTAAVRQAANRDLFLERVRRETGLEVQVITGEEEAADGLLGVLNTINLRDFVMIDTGGASTEIVLVKNRMQLHAVSIPLGAVNITEKFLSSPAPKINEKTGKTEDARWLQHWREMEQAVAEKITGIRWLGDAAGLPVVGIGGSIRALAKIERRQTNYPMNVSHGYTMKADQLLNLSMEIACLPLRERNKLPGMDRERADIIAGGLAPLRTLMKHIRAPYMIVSECGLREGVFYRNMMPGNSLVADVLEESLQNLVQNYYQDLEHACNVRNLSLMLFDQLQALHGVPEEYSRILGAAAMLHDIGQMVDYEDHEKHGFYLTLNSRLYGLTHREQVIAAYLVAMHRTKDFKQDLVNYSSLIRKEDEDYMKKLSVLLKMAEKIDRNEYGRITSVNCYISKDHIEMMLNSEHDTSLQASAVMKNEKAFNRVFNRKLVVL